MDCGHGNYQCTAPAVLQGPNGQVQIMVTMWCVECGAIELRVPQPNQGDIRMAEIRQSGAPPLPIGDGPKRGRA